MFQGFCQTLSETKTKAKLEINYYSEMEHDCFSLK